MRERWLKEKGYPRVEDDRLRKIKEMEEEKQRDQAFLAFFPKAAQDYLLSLCSETNEPWRMVEAAERAERMDGPEHEFAREIVRLVGEH